MVRLAELSDLPVMMEFIEDAKAYLKEQGIDQWQDGYPSSDVIENDIKFKQGYLFVKNQEVIACSALIFGNDPSYNKIKGKWITRGKRYATIHRIAFCKNHRGKGIGQEFFLELLNKAKEQGIDSLRIDTHKDNKLMQHILLKLNFSFCGEVHLVDTGELRLAYEKIL